METIKVDVLVAGGGLGGLMAATRARSEGATVALLGGTPGGSHRVSSFCTALADSPDDERAGLLDDILLAGAFLNDPRVVAAMVDRIGRETLLLDEIGVPLLTEDGRFVRRQAAGSSRPWAVFSLGMVGLEACQRLLDRLRRSEGPRVEHLSGAFVLDLLKHEGRVAGGLAYVTAEERWIQIEAGAVVLGTGGAGKLYGKTTNPPGSLGTGHALALEAGASLVDMEFVSFEPFITAAPESISGRDLPTTVLREGAKLRNGLGEEFLDTARTLSKDVICRAMVREVSEGRGSPSGAIYYDIREMPEAMVGRYTQIGQLLRSLGVASREAQIEVMPVQHCVVGGIQAGPDASTSVAGLYSAGEAAGGTHGAHRLATVGGTEAVALGAIAGESAAIYALSRGSPPRLAPTHPRPELANRGLSRQDQDRMKRIGRALVRGCGIIRDGEALAAAVAELRTVRDELRSEGRLKSFAGRSALVALCIALPALVRTESRRDHFRTDWPRRDDSRWMGNLVLGYDERAGDVRLSYAQAGIAARAATPLPAE